MHVIHVLEPTLGHLSSAGEYIHDDFEGIYSLEMLENALAKLKKITAVHQEDTFSIVTNARAGDPYTVIRKLIEKGNIDLVIMGEKGITDAEEFFLGSITDKVIRNAACPVITVKSVLDDSAFEHIVYATDLEEDQDEAMKIVKKFQRLFKSTVHIVKVNTRKNFHNDIDTRVAMEKLADKYGLKKYTLNSYSHEDEEYGIIYFADDKKAELIIMGVHEKSGFRRLINGGSLASEVADHTFRPVLTFQTNQSPS